MSQPVPDFRCNCAGVLVGSNAHEAHCAYYATPPSTPTRGTTSEHEEQAMGDVDDRCVHCGAGVRPDGGGDWIHRHGLYRCQSSDVAYGHLAHPANVPCRADGPNPCLGAITEDAR